MPTPWKKYYMFECVFGSALNKIDSVRIDYTFGDVEVLLG